MVVLAHQEPSISKGRLAPGEILVGQEYFWIRDQTGRLWAWWISYDLAVDWGIEPESPLDQAVSFYLVPWWVKLVDADGVIWWLYPEVDGSPLAAISQPANGDGIVGSPKLRVRGGRVRYQYTIVGGAVDVDPV